MRMNFVNNDKMAKARRLLNPRLEEAKRLLERVAAIFDEISDSPESRHITGEGGDLCNYCGGLSWTLRELVILKTDHAMTSI